MNIQDNITIEQLTFQPFISEKQIHESIIRLSEQLNRDYDGKPITILIVMKGAFMFAADLVRHIHNVEAIEFITISSYEGTQSSGTVTITHESKFDLSEKHVLVLEDIVDTGQSMSALLKDDLFAKADSVEVCTLLYKPDNIITKLDVKYVGFSIPSAFVVGYGLDYNQKGRELPCIYQKV